ncbi:hemerythrin domain-containing protein [Porifericola rhodea]|uniref:hemerythrin domain-containing protein n=1 Tax=Porifericola rhodea TaxID=930972 RepID=UPI0026663D8C|nr:hemerythrin domain-containing protein [Porifericola rhodea]WKN33186.1 hemerythrin domain-containing protein [Porifericola rhodea]
MQTRRPMNIDTNKRITDIVDENYAYASVLYYFGIKFYDYDEKTLEQVCSEKGLDVKQVIHSLESVSSSDVDTHPALSAYPIDVIIEYLKHTHFIFIKDRLPYLSKLIKNLQPTEYKPIVEDLQFIFPLFVEDLIYHIYQEEDEFFSYISSLQDALMTPQSANKLYFDMEKYSIQDFAISHDVDDDEMKGIRNITNDYNTKNINSLHLRVVFAELQHFEKELKTHASIENEILFPKALMLEKQVRKFFRDKSRMN